jgi:hypothetical protein
MVFSLYIAKWSAIKKHNLPYNQSGCHVAKCDAEHEVKKNIEFYTNNNTTTNNN